MIITKEIIQTILEAEKKEVPNVFKKKYYWDIHTNKGVVRFEKSAIKLIVREKLIRIEEVAKMLNVTVSNARKIAVPYCKNKGINYYKKSEYL